MEEALYREMFELEASHWWFVGRRRIIDALLRRLPMRRDAEVLEVGCGSGGNLSMLVRYGRLHACEHDEEARKRALALGVTERIESCLLPGALPFEGRLFDLIVLFDVLEHIVADGESLVTIRQRLRADGWLVLAVPVFPFLWSAHDVRNHHARRYTRKTLNRLIEEAGFRRVYGSFFNFWMFLPVVLIRLTKKFRTSQGVEVRSDLAMPSGPINRFLTWLLASERLAMGRFSLPFGVSYIMSAQPAAG